MNLLEYAKTELNAAWPDITDGTQQAVIKDVLDLVEVFSAQGHSGASAPYVLNLFNRLARWLPVKAITGDDSEWGEPYGEENTQQNLRYCAVFRKNFDNSTAVNIEGRVFIDKDGYHYTCRDSRVPIEFPYYPPDKPEFVRKDINE